MNFVKCYLEQFDRKYDVRRATARTPPSPRYQPTQGCDDASPLRPVTPLVVMGVQSPSDRRGLQRRRAIRETWMRALGAEALACFVLSKYAPKLSEESTHLDVMRVDANESHRVIRSAPKYRRGRGRGRGMPTFKQWAFFCEAVRRWPHVSFVAKIDDDTLPNLGLWMTYLPFDVPYAFLGPIHWSAVVPAAIESGVRIDRCAFGWDSRSSLANFGKDWGGGSCADRGAVLPVPYAAGAGYAFGTDLLKRIVSDPNVVKWVEEASGPSRETLQWQKNEDLTTGYWLSYLEGVNVAYRRLEGLHDHRCTTNERRLRPGLYRPPTNTSVLVHSLKSPNAMRYAWHILNGGAYDRSSCIE